MKKFTKTLNYMIERDMGGIMYTKKLTQNINRILKYKNR